MSSRARDKRRKSLGTIGLILLAVVTLAVAGFAFTAQQDVPEPSIDLARAEAAAKKAEQGRADRARAAIEAVTVPLVFPASGPLRVLYAGDSLSEGYYTSAPEKAFRPLVTAALKSSGDIEEVGTYKAGAGVQYVVNNFPTPENIDLAIIELGTNDSRTEGGAPAFTDRYNAYLSSLKAASPNMQLICLSVWAPTNTRTIPYNKAISETCAAQGGRYLDLSALFPIPTLRGPEGVETWGGPSDVAHPNDSGHKAIADEILKKIRR